MTEQEIIKDIRENKIGKYKENDLLSLLKEAKSICDKVKFDTPLSNEVANYNQYGSSIAFDNSWKTAKNLQESIDIALDSRKNWENPGNADLYTVLSSMEKALHSGLDWLITDSKYKEAYQWLDEKEAFYQKQLMERNERASDPFKKAQWELERKKKEDTGIPHFEPQSCTWVYLDYTIGKDDHYYNINKDGSIKKSELTRTEVLARTSKTK